MSIVFREPRRWPRALHVADKVFPLTDYECRVLRDGLEVLIDKLRDGGHTPRNSPAFDRANAAARLLYVWITGRMPRDTAARAAWRAAQAEAVSVAASASTENAATIREESAHA